VDPATKAETLVTRENVVWMDKPVILDQSHLGVDLRLDQRRKGLLWYSTYGVGFRGDYAYVHDDDRDGILVITYRFPTQKAIYDNFRLEVNGRVDPKIGPVSEGDVKIVQQEIPVAKGARIPFAVAYQSRGLDSWKYSFGSDVNRVKDFRLDMTTDFDKIDFPDGTISPTTKEKAAAGWRLVWSSENLISGFMVGMTMPARINPGPLAAEISSFAPISLAFFFMWMFIITVMKKIELHPMNYLFLGAAFFAFHLLFSYTVDHIDIVTAFVISSAVSVFLVVSYLRLVVGLRFAAIEAGLSQLVYLVFFSYAHFLEGFTGLIVTAGSILTLYFLMQLTGRIKWAELFVRRQAVPQTTTGWGA
jgi:inner membrane protein involved in colicin E2 resistance